jgi:hypothetical protein
MTELTFGITRRARRRVIHLTVPRIWSAAIPRRFDLAYSAARHEMFIEPARPSIPRSPFMGGRTSRLPHRAPTERRVISIFA